MVANRCADCGNRPISTLLALMSKKPKKQM